MAIQQTAPTRIPNYRRVHDSLQQLGVNTDSLYRSLHIREEDFDDDSAGVTMAAHLELLNRAAEQRKDPYLGISMARTRDVANLGVVGYMVRSAPDFGRSLTIVDSYLELVTPGARCGLLNHGDSSTWTYDVDGFSPDQCRHEVEMTLMQFVNAIRELLSLPDWRPLETCFRHAPPEDADPVRAAFSERLTFHHSFNGVSFPTGFLAMQTSDSDPQLLHVLEQQVQRSISQLKRGSNLRDRISFLISSQIGQTEISAESLAASLGMSRRTLHRRLAEQETSVGQLRDFVVFQIAKEVLLTTSVSITQLAQQLGYSDASAFDRAFKRLSGQTPQTFRRDPGNQPNP
ncbi:AraC family transcriptional regulator [Seongchinamella unica]|uniref:AraC family transcriptional regulator n=1 Tax=Seongchinamella unica TaxID=2547392 RepID=A0A4R5LPH2_9GAMM|nr:AraC family transcriptional regulator [Seongchinamella unica]TDG12151.1 AraC family transcriptional regulator [Seongchinamella unica]